jgi:hypothetical protein
LAAQAEDGGGRKPYPVSIPESRALRKSLELCNEGWFVTRACAPTGIANAKPAIVGNTFVHPDMFSLLGNVPIIIPCVGAPSSGRDGAMSDAVKKVVLADRCVD